MSYLYIPSGSSGATDRLVVSRRMADLMSPYAPGHLWGISSGSGDPAAPAQTTGSFAEAFADTILQSVGFQTFDEVFGGGAAGYTGATFADADFASFVWTPPVSKTYLVHVDVQAYSHLGGGNFELKLNVDGTDYPTAKRVYINCNTVDQTFNTSFRVPVPFVGGVASTLKVRWKSNGVNQINADSSSSRRAFTVTG